MITNFNPKNRIDMKKISILVLLLAIFFVGCNENSTKTNEEKETTDSIVTQTNSSMEFTGNYKSLLPCASCPGILVNLKLNEDKTFEKEDFYLSEKEGSFVTKGAFSVDEEQKIVTLESENDTIKFAVEDNALVMLDKDGEKTTSEFAEMYKFSKLSDEEVEFTEKPIRGFLTFGHEVSEFSPCGSSKSYWIIDFEDGKLNKLYSEEVGETPVPYTPVMAELVLQKEEPATEGFAEQYDGVVKAVEVKSVKAITADNFYAK